MDDEVVVVVVDEGFDQLIDASQQKTLSTSALVSDMK